MRSARGAPLRITIELPPSGPLQFRFEAASAPPLRPKTDWGHQELTRGRRELYEFLKNRRAELRVSDHPNFATAFRDLNELGRTLLGGMFENVQEVVNYCRAACPGWYRELNEGEPPPLIQIVAGRDNFFPMDYLPLFNPAAPETNLNNLFELTAAVRRFPCFVGVVERVLGEWKCPAVDLGPPPLSLAFFHYGELEAASLEWQFLSNHHHINADEPWPGPQASVDNFPKVLLDRLWAPDKSSAGGDRRPPDQMYHFACHCDTSDDNPNQHWLKLRSGRGTREFELKVANIYSDRVDRHAEIAKNRPLPLVFLNACESAGTSAADGVPAFPQAFLRNQHLGFIGTLVPIGDEHAAQFSQRFYTLLLKGTALGHATYLARWALVKRYRNLSGLFYAVYASPDIKVRQA